MHDSNSTCIFVFIATRIIIDNSNIIVIFPTHYVLSYINTYVGQSGVARLAARRNLRK